MSIDGAHQSKSHEFLALCSQNKLPDIKSTHFIIHNNTLCIKILNVRDIMEQAVKIPN